MRRSFVRLIIVCVLIAWVVGFAILILYSRSLSWTEERARTDGVFLAFELLDRHPPKARDDRLDEIREHFPVDFALLSVEEVERRLGREVEPGEQIPHEVSPREEWYFLSFGDGNGALAAGPVNPARPPIGYAPIGVLLALVGLPLIAGLLALRVERELRKVERASAALAAGKLDARVKNPRGPSIELAASFDAMAERVERLIRSRDELVQAVSHELGSPLSRLRFHMELLENLSDTEREVRLDEMSRELDALDELVAELLSYAQSDELVLERLLFDPRCGLADLAELARLEAPRDREIRVDLDVHADLHVFADRRLFLRAVENLLRNAAQHAHSAIRVELKQVEKQIQVTIHDDGPGIPPEQRERASAPFVRLEVDRSRRTGGIGLGLAIVRRIVDRHGGRLEISESPLGGAAVSTLWPLSGFSG